MADRTKLRLLAVSCAGVAVMACQAWDRLEPDRIDALAAGDRGTLFDTGGGPSFGGGGPLTEELAARWVRQIEASAPEQRLSLADQFLDGYPEAEVISYLHELVGDAHTELGQSAEAADAYERAIGTSWPAPDILALPLVNLELPFQAGWARYQAGDQRGGIEWLVRTTFVSDLPQLEQGLRFMYSERGGANGGFDAWLAGERAAVGVTAPDFELPGYRAESVRLQELAGRLTLLNFWTPT